ncbi:Dam family site-specific DNA-(adenine-N6)-methyltransferase [Escherichia coli]|uniref:Dam family site-specific DNA-(adenine-N6)-methyltransferase n=3 Tax=Escherichia coli TaxID=562 RepID=UPI0035B59DC2
MSTILKWAGNKTAVMSELKKHLPAGPRLVEPFAGSCAVMMETDYPSYLVADINPDLINLYKKVAADCEAFISRARALFEEANRELAYYNIRQEFNYSTEITDFMKAVYFLYLNRHGYRGLCRYNKSGHFNIPYGNYKNPYFPEKEIRAFAEKAQQATFICASFDETLAMLQVGDVVNASSSNPAHRRNEMMACVKGLELIAEMRGDCAVFYTITCPSRFHSTLNNGRPNAEYVNAWASLHRVQQFRFFGIPGRQAYRELRLLAGQAARQQGDKKAGAPVLDNPRLDAILAAADAGCFATYIMKQGGVLVPRKYHLIRTAYEINEEPTAYGDHGIRIYGIWSPIAEGKICTHAVKWKMVRKAVDVQEAAADQGACAPWTRGNNCPLAENLNQQGKDKSADGDTRTDITCMDDKELHDYLHSMSKKERRELAARLRLVKPKRRKDYKQRITDHQRQQLVYELKSRGFNGSEKEVDLLLRGGSIPSGAGLRIFYRNQRLQEDDKWRNLY